MSVVTYDLTVSDVASLIGHVGTIGLTTSPSSTAVTSWITEYSSIAAAAMRAASIDPADVVSTADGYLLELYHAARSHIARRVAAQWYTANRLGDPDLAISYRIQWDQWIASIRTDRASTVGETTGTGWRTSISSATRRDPSWRRGRGYR